MTPPRSHPHNDASRFIHCVIIAFTLAFCLVSPVHASAIEPYDFGTQSARVTKVWSEDVAHYVAERFATDNGIDPHSVSVKRLTAGATNHFIYLMFIEHELTFVIKGLGTRREAELLLALQNHLALPDVQSNPLAAHITLSKRIHSYRVDGDPNPYYFAILEAAPGRELFKIMCDALLQQHDLTALNDIFYRIGQQHSELHKSFVGKEHFITPRNLVTVIHDDLHPENTFYDLKTQTFSLIDNESIGATLTHPLPVIRELYGFYEIPIIRWPTEKISIDLLREANPHDIASLYYQFILGMSSVYQNSEDAKHVFLTTLIEINNMAIDFLTYPYSKPWMRYPQDKHEGHIVWGKLSTTPYNRRLAKQYINNLTIINADLQASL